MKFNMNKLELNFKIIYNKVLFEDDIYFFTIMKEREKKIFFKFYIIVNLIF